MDKTQRLFAIMDTLRRHRRPTTADQMAAELGVSVRTVYRDVQTLIGLGAPIDGEAGVGYLLRPGFFLPPLMFSADELDALGLGARWVERLPDAALGRAARNAIAKIATAAPDDLRDRIGDLSLWPVGGPYQGDNPLLGVLREAMRGEQAVTITYADEAGATSERTIWPVALAFYDFKQIVAAWCTSRVAFRHFRTDRIAAATPAGTRFGRRRAVLFKEWSKEFHERRAARRREAEAAQRPTPLVAAEASGLGQATETVNGSSLPGLTRKPTDGAGTASTLPDVPPRR